LAEATLLVTAKHRSELAAVKGFEQRALEQNLLREVAPEDNQARVLVSNGATLSDQQVRIVNPETLTECAPDEVGEVWVSGSSVTRGYWNRPEETRQTFGAYLADTGEGPFLRTGDMGFLRDAELFIAGRLKDLVIIRGLNHYPQDIELTAEQSCAALRPGCGAAFSVEVEGEEQLVIVYEIERYAELDITEAAAAIRQAVSEQHEVQVYAVSLIETGTIPKTSSGKLQRRACRARFLAGSLDVVAEWRGAILDTKSETPQLGSSNSAPQTVDDIAAWLTSHLAARVGVAISEIDVNQSFARCGVDSLAAIEMAHEVETRLGICVSIVSFLESTSILQFASELEQQLTRNPGALSVSESKAEPVATKDYALSYGQRSLWFLHNMESSSAAYNIFLRPYAPFWIRGCTGN
jgi:acyl carrier protein